LSAWQVHLFYKTDMVHSTHWFSDVSISQGSVATYLRCDVICNGHFTVNFVLSVQVIKS